MNKGTIMKIKKKNRKNKTLLLAGAILAVLAGIGFFWGWGISEKHGLEHVHGIAAEEGALYLGTHNGLFLLEGGQLRRISGRRDSHDFMGLSLHPRQRGVLYASGHPKGGGNLGLVRSDNRGKAWKKISEAVRGPADFHALAASRANPAVLYGWYAMMIQRSSDGGKTWEIAARNMAPVAALAPSPRDADTVFGIVPAGIIKSSDRGKNWEVILGTQKRYFTAIAAGEQALYGYGEREGIMKSDDGTQWETLSLWPEDDSVTHLTVSTTNPKEMYVVTQNNNIYKSEDSGRIWKQAILK